MSGKRPILSQTTILLAAITLCPPLAADQGYYDKEGSQYNDVPELPPWQEGSVTLPAYPEDEHLLEFKVGAVSPAAYRFLVDEESVSLGEDGVVRYTAVIEADSGSVRNVFFEGIRCDANSYATYAFATDDGRWKKMPVPQWQAIRSVGGAMGFRYDLAQRYFCHPYSGTFAKKEILNKLRWDLDFQFSDDDQTYY